MSEDKSSKPNGVGSDPMQRLASFKPPRDLTLGGIKTSKKVFTPNLNVSRNKNKGPSKSQNNQKKDEKDKRDRRNDRNKNFHKNGPNIIKSTGVFSEGLGSAERHSSSRGSYGSRDSDTVQTMQKPTIRVKDFVKIDKELEEQKIRSVMGQDHSEEEEVEDFKLVKQRDAPIKLPMDDGGWSQVKPSVTVKQEIVVKSEPEDNNSVSVERKEDRKPKPDVKKEVCDNTDVVNLLRSTEPTLIFLQLPDSLPGRGGKMEDDAPRRKANEPSTSNDDDKEQKPVDNRCRLSDLEEGRIGKLLLHRSGRVSLALGDTMFEVTMGTCHSFQQELVSVGVDHASRSAALVSLGALTHKLHVLPAWEHMFMNISV